MDYSEEKWAPITGYGGIFVDRYEISDHGRVRSLLNSNRRPDGGILKQKITRGGYKYVGLSTPKGYKPKMISVGIAKQVALAWVENPNDLPEVDHIDHSKDNNHHSNLQWIAHNHNCRRSQGYLYRLELVDRPGQIEEFQSRRQLERHLGHLLRRSGSFNLTYYLRHQLGSPNRFGWIIHVVKQKGSQRWHTKRTTL